SHKIESACSGCEVILVLPHKTNNMFCGQLISHHLPSLHLHDKVSQALQLMADHKVSHLPVVNDEKYIGLVGEDDLLEADENQLLETLSQHFSNVFVRFNDHILIA